MYGSSTATFAWGSTTNFRGVHIFLKFVVIDHTFSKMWRTGYVLYKALVSMVNATWNEFTVYHHYSYSLSSVTFVD